MASRLRRATLVLHPAKPAPAAPVGELEAIPVLGASLLARSASGPANDAIDVSTELLCRKGTATTSRWRSYDHKDAFEPAQAATAPPSDADVMGSWLKYEGSVPVTTPLDQAVRDEELPTSWTKYDEKPPLASLLESRERLRKAPIYLAEAAPPAPEQHAQPEIPAAPTSLDRAEPQPALRPAEPAAVAEAPPVPAELATSEAVRALIPEPEAEIEIPAAPIEEASAEAPEPALQAAPSAPETPLASAPQPPDELEAQPAQSLSLSGDSSAASEEPEASGDPPVEGAPAPMPEAEAAPVAFVEEPAVLATPTEPMAAAPSEEAPPSEAPTEPTPAEPLVSDLVSASTSAPEFPATPIDEPAPEAPESASLPALQGAPELPSPAPAYAAELPDRTEANAELPPLPEETEAPTAEIGDAWAQPRPTDVSEELEPSVEVPLEPAPAPMAQVEAAPAVSAEEPEVLVAAAEPMATSLPLAEPPRGEAPTEPELLASAVTAYEPEQPPFDPEPAVETRAAAAVSETAAEATPSGAEPNDQRELLQMAVSAIKKPGSTKKAMLTRLAEMLEQALSVKRSARNTGKPPVASEPETPAPSAEPSPDAVQPETPAEATEPAAPEIVADAVVPVEATIDPVPLPTIADADAVPSEAFSPPEPAAPLPEMETPPEATEPAAPEIVAAAVVPVEATIDPVPLPTIADADAVPSEAFSPPEPAAPLAEMERPPEATEPVAPEASADAVVSIEAAPDPVPLAAIADVDGVQPEALAPAEPAGVVEPVSVGSDELVVGDAEPTPELEAILVSPPPHLTLPEPVAPSADTSPEIAAIPEPQRSVEAPETAAELTALAATPDVEAMAEHEGASEDATPSPLPETGPPQAPSAEDHVLLAADLAAHSAERASDPEPEAAAPIEAPPVTEAVAVALEAAAAPVPLAPVAPIDEETAAREALASDLADMIRNVLSTKQFATRATKADRYFSVQPVQATEEPEPQDLGDASEIAADALPHPVAIKSRLGRMERALALVSLAMMILVGYFAVSLWRDDGVVAARAPVIAPTASSASDRTRDATRGLGAAAIDAPKSAVSPAPGGPRPVDRR